MADTKEKKGKKTKKIHEDTENADVDGDEKKPQKMRGGKDKTSPEGKEMALDSIEGDLSSLPMESKGTDTLLEDVPETESKGKKEDDIKRPLKWHPDEIHCRQLCLNCLKINYYWPPRPRPPTPPGKDPNLIYPGDVDPEFKPARGDILIVHPKGLGVDPKPSPDDLWWKSKRIGGGFCICYDGDKKFKFQVGDLVLRIGSYVEEEIEALPLEDEEKEQEGKGNNTKKGKKSLKPKKIADPPQLDPVTYKPYDKVELYRCSGSELLNEEPPSDIDPLEIKLKRVVQTNTNYDISIGTITRRKSWKDGDLVLKGDTKQTALPIIFDPPESKTLDVKVASQEKGGKSNEVKILEHWENPETKQISKAENLAFNFVKSRDSEKLQGGKTELESQDLDAKKGATKDEKLSRIKLIWTFLGSQSQLCIPDNVNPTRDSKCPGLGCFYTPYLNLGNHCKKQDHNHPPFLADILIPQEAWSKKFDHRKNEWQSLVEWYLDPPPPQILLEGNVGPIDDLPHEGEASNVESEKGKRRNSKEKADKNKEKEGMVTEKKIGKGKGNKQEENKKSLDTSNSEKGLVQSSLLRKKSGDGKGKELIVPLNILPQEKADKAIQVPQDLEEKDENLDSQIMPTNLRKELTLGTILVCPLVGRKFDDEKAPIEEWKWPRKYKLWGSAEMYMLEQGAENLANWAFWGKSDRICDTQYPPPELGAKQKFLHPKDAKVDLPGYGKDVGEEPLSKEGDTNKPPKVDNNARGAGGGEDKPTYADGNDTKESKRKVKFKEK